MDPDKRGFSIKEDSEEEFMDTPSVNINPETPTQPTSTSQSDQLQQLMIIVKSLQQEIEGLKATNTTLMTQNIHLKNAQNELQTNIASNNQTNYPVHSSNPKVKPKDPETFSGVYSVEVVNNFVESFKNYFAGRDISDNEKKTKLVTHLTKDALSWYRDMKKDNPRFEACTYDELLKAIQTEYLTGTLKDDLKEKLKKFRFRPQDSLAQFNSNFRKLAVDYRDIQPNVDKRIIVQFYIDKLPIEFGEFMRDATEYSSLSQAIDEANQALRFLMKRHGGKLPTLTYPVVKHETANASATTNSKRNNQSNHGNNHHHRPQTTPSSTSQPTTNSGPQPMELDKLSIPMQKHLQRQSQSQTSDQKPTTTATTTYSHTSNSTTTTQPLRKLTEAEKQKLAAAGICFRCRSGKHFAKDCKGTAFQQA
jgi:regulator of replication initiation timing